MIADVTTLANPVPKSELNVVGAVPKPMNPVLEPLANPSLKPVSY